MQPFRVIFRGLKIYHVKVRSALTTSGLPDVDYSLNPYLGCNHGCIYCYARLYTRDHVISSNWGKVIAVKSNIVSVLRRTINKYRPGIVGVGTITDAYQPLEAVYYLTQNCIRILLEKGFYISIQTKNPLVLRDLNILTKYANRVDVGFTITTLDYKTSSFLEPKAPPPKARARALSKLRSKGIKTWIFYGPVVPGINDDDETIESIMKLALETESTLYYDPLHIRPFMTNKYHPLQQYLAIDYQDWWTRTKRKILEYCEAMKLTCKPGFTGDAYPKSRVH